jgi:hypothetical protein
MTTILLSYDEKNPLAISTLNYLKKVGFIKTKPHKTRLDAALEDIEKGNVYHLCRRAKV